MENSLLVTWEWAKGMKERGDALVAIGRDVRRLEKAPSVQFRAASLHCLRRHNGGEEEDRG